MVMVSPSHVVYLSALCSTVITRFIATTANSATHTPSLKSCVLHLYFWYSHPWKSSMGFLGCVISLYKFANAFDPGDWCFLDSPVLPPNIYCLLRRRTYRLSRHRFRGYCVHLAVSAQVFRCLRFASFVTYGDVRLARWWDWFSLPSWDFHP